MPTPLLLVSDGVTSGTGLGRITRDLAVRIADHLPDLYRLGTLGYGGPYSRAFSFPQYQMDMQDWQINNLPEVWKDFAGNEKGIVLTIWDASRMLWFARPENCTDSRLKKFLTNPPFERWGYFPMDATGPHDRLTAILGHIIDGYDRVLAYSKWAEEILHRTLPKKDITNLPHGIDCTVFMPRPRIQSRHSFGAKIGAVNEKLKFLAISDDAFAIGIVATNQARKDYGLAIQAIAEIAKQRPVFIWIHTDVIERHWSIPALLNDYGLKDRAVVTGFPLTDEQMSWCYSAMDLTLGIGTGEGFGYPIFESLACGTPCIHGNDGGAAEHLRHLPAEMLVEPIACRLEGPYCCQRNVYNPLDWAKRISELPKKNGASLLPSYLDWNENWKRWEQWFRKGVNEHS